MRRAVFASVLACGIILQGCGNSSYPGYESSFHADHHLPDVHFCERSDSISNVPWQACRVQFGQCQMIVADPRSTPPLILWQTLPGDQTEPNPLQQFNAKYLPDGAEIRWVNDAGMATMMRDISREMADAHATNNVCKAFAMMRPGAYRADIWRAAVLWKYGGLYLDHKIGLFQSVSTWLPSGHGDVALMVEDRDLECSRLEGILPTGIIEMLTPTIFGALRKSCGWPGLDHGIFNAVAYASAPKLNVFACILEHVVSNIGRQSYRHDLHITGPVAWRVGGKHHEEGNCGLKHTVDLESVRLTSGHGDYLGRRFEGIMVGRDGERVMFSDASLHHSSKYTAIKYHYLFSTRQVYCTERFQFPSPSWTYWYAWLRYCKICSVFDSICEAFESFNGRCVRLEGHASAYRKGLDMSFQDPCIEPLYVSHPGSWAVVASCLFVVFSACAGYYLYCVINRRRLLQFPHFFAKIRRFIPGGAKMEKSVV